MILSRNKPAANKDGVSSNSREKDKKSMPSLEDFITKRDYTGAITLLEFYKNTGKNTLENDLWTAYCAFHLGDYKTAMEEYDKLSKKSKSDVNILTYLGCCYFMLGMYKEANDIAKKAPKSMLQNRLLFHLSHKLNNEEQLLKFHGSLNNAVEDQLSLASIHYLRNHYQEAIDVYKKILRDNESYIALNVYIALCSYKLDYYDVSQEYLALYLNQFPESATALNLKACNQFRMYNGKLAEAELKALQDMASPSFTYAKDLVKHNLTVFRNGQGALQILPPLVDVIPEARLNLVIHYLKQDEIMDANELMKDVEPVTPQDYILKGIVNAIIGQEQQSKDHLKTAHQLFDLVGSSASECDTIPGRQCMAMKFFLMRQFEEVMIYLNSIKSYFFSEDNFNFMYGQAKAALGKYKEAEEAFLLIQGEKLKKDYVYLSWLVRCFIMNKKPRMAWDLYLRMSSTTESFNLLQVIANDCYKMGLFFYSAKAFDVLERLDVNPEFWEGKRGACVGAFQMIIGGHEPKESLRDVVQMLQNTDNPQVEYIIRTMKKYAKDNKVPFF